MEQVANKNTALPFQNERPALLYGGAKTKVGVAPQIRLVHFNSVNANLRFSSLLFCFFGILSKAA